MHRAITTLDRPTCARARTHEHTLTRSPFACPFAHSLTATPPLHAHRNHRNPAHPAHHHCRHCRHARSSYALPPPPRRPPPTSRRLSRRTWNEPSPRERSHSSIKHNASTPPKRTSPISLPLCASLRACPPLGRVRRGFRWIVHVMLMMFEADNC